jgi:hypothetical protein
LANLIFKSLKPELKSWIESLDVFNFWGDKVLKKFWKPKEITNIVLDNDVLIDLSNKQSQKIELNQTSISSLFISSSDLAKALRKLLDNGKNGQKARKFVRLLLSANEFTSTELHLPGVAAKDLKSAAELQGHSIFPGIQSAVSCFISPEPLCDKPDTYLVIWITQSRLDSLFDALKIEGSFLWEVIPTAAVIASTLPNKRFIDRGTSATTFVSSSDNYLIYWSQVHPSDLTNRDFLQHLETGVNETCSEEFIKPSEISDLDISQTKVVFPPSEALFLDDARRRAEKIKRLSIAVIFAIFLCSVPFLIQSVQFRSLADELASVRSLSGLARLNRDFVVGQEKEWAAINEYPEQNIPDIMFSLQPLLYPDKLKSLEIMEGTIQIEGESSNPQAILQRLEQHPLFTEAKFSRATNNNRYFIEFRLSTVNYDGYMVRYFLER